MDNHSAPQGESKLPTVTRVPPFPTPIRPAAATYGAFIVPWEEREDGDDIYLAGREVDPDDPDDVALVRSHAERNAVQEALFAAAVPAEFGELGHVGRRLGTVLLANPVADPDTVREAREATNRPITGHTMQAHLAAQKNQAALAAINKAWVRRMDALKEVASRIASLIARGMPREMVLNRVAAVAAQDAELTAHQACEVHEYLGDWLDEFLRDHADEAPVAYFCWNDFDRMAEHVQSYAGGDLVSVSAKEFYLRGVKITRADVDALVGEVLDRDRARFEPRKGEAVVLDLRMVSEVVGALARKYHVRRSEEPGGDATPLRTLELAASAPEPVAARPPILAGPGRPSGSPAVTAEEQRLYDEELEVSKGLRQLKSEIRTALGRDAKSPDDGELWKKIKAWALSRGAREEDLNMDAKLDTPRRRYVVGIVLRKLPY